MKQECRLDETRASELQGERGVVSGSVKDLVKGMEEIARHTQEPIVVPKEIFEELSSSIRLRQLATAKYKGFFVEEGNWGGTDNKMKNMN